MSSEKGDSSGKQNPEVVLAEAQVVLEAINKIRAQADEQLKVAGNSQKQVEEAAISTKSLLDEIGKIKAQVDENLKSLDSTRKKAEEEAGAVNGLLDETKKCRVQTEDHLKATEVSRKKADDDATYSSQAKSNAEAHAKSVATFKGQAEGEFTTITTNRQKSDELLQAITVGKAASDADTRVISDSKKSIEHATEGIVSAADEGAARLKEVLDAKDAVAAARKETETLCDAASLARTKAETGQKQVEQFLTQATALASKMTEAHRTSTQQTAEIGELLTAAKADEESLAKILAHLNKSDLIATEHEERIAKQSRDLEALIKKVEGLLPGATSAGLASAFNTQKKRFGSPQKNWLWAFVVCIVGLIAVALPSFINAAAGNTAADWGPIFRGFAMRLPIVIPLVWLAIYAGRNYMLLLRLEEEYAHKEAISISFEGYKREMEKIAAGDANNPTPLTTLCINILRAIAERPGRIYEGKSEDLTVFNEMKVAAERADEFRKKNIATE